MHSSKLIIIVLASIAAAMPCWGQKKTAQLTYYRYEYHNEGRDTALTNVEYEASCYHIQNVGDIQHPIPGYAEKHTYVNNTTDSVYYQYRFSDSSYYTVSALRRDDIQWDTQHIDSKTTRYVTSINSNRIELVFSTRYGKDITPLPYYGRFQGVMTEMRRNGQVQMELAPKATPRVVAPGSLIPRELGVRKSSRELSNLEKRRMVLTTRVFNDEQICWGKESSHVEEMPRDTTLHFAGGTLILKRLRLPKLPSHYQTFVELRQRSNGDAYDRTGSVFIIPDAGNSLCPTFFDAINGHPDSLPSITGRDGQRYQGIVPGISLMQRYRISSLVYTPPVELMRFFTPFGVGHYNERIRLDGLDWEEETFYKQEVTDLQSLLQGDVWIGCFIGNYDGGGHRVTLDIKSYPGDYEWDLDDDTYVKGMVQSLVNTCNVLEMAGQNYGKIFGTDSITVSFAVTPLDSVLTLRYISTGHGGWGEGDEFVPKENELFIDGVKRFGYTPWRSDCGRYREWNPVSGNFWNGLSSSDLSRSGWCPGTATQPVYFDLSGLEPGTHTLTIAIPQGQPIEGGFSHWNVSVQLISRFKDIRLQ
ncbi:MAG: glpgli family protein [Bacteroidales bacterium]|nr:glpgli family protein [Bacteroidales bacterium]